MHAAHRAHGKAQILRQQFGPVVRRIQSMLQMTQRFVQRMAMARSGQQRRAILAINFCCTICCSNFTNSETPSPVLSEMDMPS